MIVGNHDEKTLEQFQMVRERAVRTALMADGHFGYDMPIGGVAAYKDEVNVAGVGFDIACGNYGVKTNLNIDEADPHDLEEIANEIFNKITFGTGGVNQHPNAPTNHRLFEDPRWWIIPEPEREQLKDKARKQLGTVGSGNHYVDVFADEEGWIWVGVHFGSRGFGHTVASNFLAIAQGLAWGEKAKPGGETILPVRHDAYAPGNDYLALMKLAGEYAYAGREWVVRYVVEGILGAHICDEVHNHHNYAWEERHVVPADWEREVTHEEFIVVRKGATPAFPGQRGFVGGSMGDDAVILRGVDVEETDDPVSEGASHGIRGLQKELLYSTVHGAGRVMGRREAKGKYNRRGELKTPGKITPEMMDDWIGERGVILRGGGLDEAPQAYKRLPEVLEAHGPTIEIEHTLTPLIVCMAGEGR